MDEIVAEIERAHPEPPAKTAGAGGVRLPPDRELSDEEQMARYEEALKEADWGHQPC